MVNFWKPNTLFCEGSKKNMSIGRMGLWCTLIPAIMIWLGGNDIKTHHLWVLGFFIAYNSYKKMDMFIDLIKAWRGK